MTGILGHSEKSTFTQSKYRTLAEQLRQQIKRGALQPGDRLPSFVELRALHGATPTTANQVYTLLEQEGLVERQQGRGTFVARHKSVLTGNIGFVGQSYKGSGPFNAHIMEGVQQAVTAHHQHLLYMGTDYTLDLQACAKMDGALICNIEDTATVANRLPLLMPRVSLLIAADGMPSVIANDYEGARKATQHLINLGHRRIACLMEKYFSIPRRRFAGYRDALQDADIEMDSQLVRLTKNAKESEPSNPRQYYLEWGKTQMRQWLRNGWQESGATAILVQNEVAAIGVMQILEEEGIRVPDDVSIIGFDGTEISELVTPHLTAMRLPLAEIGTKAVEILNRQIGEEEINEQVIALPMVLNNGESVAPPHR